VAAEAATSCIPDSHSGGGFLPRNCTEKELFAQKQNIVTRAAEIYMSLFNITREKRKDVSSRIGGRAKLM
jgi:hypothetical protein